MCERRREEGSYRREERSGMRWRLLRFPTYCLDVFSPFLPRSSRKIKVRWHIYNSVPRAITHCHGRRRPRAPLSCSSPSQGEEEPPQLSTRMDMGWNRIRPLRESLHRSNDLSSMYRSIVTGEDRHSPSSFIRSIRDSFLDASNPSFSTSETQHVLLFFLGRLMVFHFTLFHYNFAPWVIC